MGGTKITNVRGTWEHYDCARAAYDRVHSRGWVQGKQNDMLDALKNRPLERVTVVYDPAKQIGKRWYWEAM
jgi:hypothetical protein